MVAVVAASVVVVVAVAVAASAVLAAVAALLAVVFAVLQFVCGLFPFVVALQLLLWVWLLFAEGLFLVYCWRSMCSVVARWSNAMR